QHELQDRHVDLEQVRDHVDAGPCRAAWPLLAIWCRQRTRLRVIRLTMASSTTAPRNDPSSPGRLMSPELIEPAPTSGLMSQPPRKAPMMPTTILRKIP